MQIKVRLVHILSTETSTVLGGRIDLLYNVLKKEGQQRGQKKKEVETAEWEAEKLHKLNKTKRRERDYIDEALALGTNESVESLDIGSRYRIQILKEAPAKSTQPQLIRGWAVSEEHLNR